MPILMLAEKCTVPNRSVNTFLENQNRGFQIKAYLDVVFWKDAWKLSKENNTLFPNS